MSSIILQDVDNIHYTSFKFDYLAINTDDVLDQLDDEILLVNQTDSRFSMILKNNGLFLNTTRDEAQTHVANNISLYAQNAHFEGSVTVGSIKILNNDLSNSNIDNLLNAITTNIGPFYPYIDPLYDTYKNYFTHNNINILANADSHLSRSNLHPLNITRSAEYSANNAQLAIRNNIDDNTNNQSELLFGILGNKYHSPATIVTNPGKALEFYISKANDVIDDLYNNNNDIPIYTTIPTLKIDTSNCVNINSSNFKTLAYSNIIDTTKLNVEGLAYIADIFVYDHLSNKPNHLNDIYIRKGTTNFYPHQVYEGSFNGNFQFNSNVTINTLHTSNITTDTINVNSNANFNTITSDNINATDIYYTNNLYHNDESVSVTHIDIKLVYYTEETIRDNLLDTYFYNSNEITSNITYSILNTGINTRPYGINTTTHQELSNKTSNILYSTDIDYYTEQYVLSNIHYRFSNLGSNSVLEYINTNYDSSIITKYTTAVFTDLSNVFIDTVELYTPDDLTSNIYDILYYDGYENITSAEYLSNTDLQFNFDTLSNILQSSSIIFDEDCNITSNIISNIISQGFCNLYNSYNYNTDTYYLQTIHSNIECNLTRINSNYRHYLSNIVIKNTYTEHQILNLIYDNGINSQKVISNFDFDSNIEVILALEIIDSNTVLSNYNYKLLHYGYSNIDQTYVISIGSLKSDLTSINIDNSNLLSFENCVSNISTHIDENTKHIKLTSNLDRIFNTFDYKIEDSRAKETIINRLLLNFITNYDSSNTGSTQSLRYHVNDKITFNGNNVTLACNVAIGKNDNYGSVLAITRDNNKPNNKSEIIIKDIYSNDKYEVCIGHKDTKDFMIKTNNIIDHNIILQAGNKTNLFLKYNSAYVGINTTNPTKTLDVNGDIIANDFYKRYLGQNVKLYHFIEHDDKIKLLDNTKQLEINTIVTFKNDIHINKVFKKNQELFNFTKNTLEKVEYLYSDVGCLFIGQRPSVDKKSIENTAMYLQNTADIIKNNTVLRLLASDKKQNNNDHYTGIEITKYKNATYSGWYLHNNHCCDNKNIEEFDIGYRNNDNVKFPILKSTYNGKINKVEIGHKDCPVEFNNDVIINGDIDVKGIYKLNGVEFSSNSIKLSTIIDTHVSDELEPATGDIIFAASKRIINTTVARSSVFIGEYTSNYDFNNGFTPYFNNYMVAHSRKVLSSESNFDAKLNIVTPVTETHITSYSYPPPLLAVKGTYSTLSESNTLTSSIRLALLDTRVDTVKETYWENTNYTDIAYNLYSNYGMFSIDLTYNEYKLKPFQIITNGPNNIYTKLTSDNYSLEKDSNSDNYFFHILDDDKNNLLVLERPSNNDVTLSLKNLNNKWDIIANTNFTITNDTSKFIFNNTGVGIYTEDPLASLHINNKNNIGLLIENKGNLEDRATIQTHINTNNITDLNIIRSSNKSIYNLSNLTTHYTYNPHISKQTSNIIINQTYNCNFTGSNIINTIADLYSNYYSYNISDYDSESNFTFNINIDISTLNTILESKLNSSNISNISLNSNITTFSNNTYTNAKIQLNTIESIDTYIITADNSSNYLIYLGSNNGDTQLMSNFTYSNITIGIYHNSNYKYNYSFDAKIDVDLTYTIETNVISGIAKDPLSITSNSDTYTINYLKDNINTNTISSNIISNLRTTKEIDGYEKVFNINDITLTHYDLTKGCNVTIEINQPIYHIKLKNNDSNNYCISAENSNFQIIYDNNTKLESILELTSKSELTIDTLNVANIHVSGQIYDTITDIFCNEDFNTINIKNNHLYIKTEDNYNILFNTNVQDDGNESANVIFGNTDRPYDEIITLQSSSSNAFIKFTSTEDTNIYKLGKSSNNFNILHNDSNILKITKNNTNITVTDLVALDSNNDGKVDENEFGNSDVDNTSYIIKTQYDYDFYEGRLQNIKNINYTSNLVFTENGKVLMAMNTSNITIHQRLVCYNGVTTGSDRRIKDNINMIENALDKIDKLNGVSYYNKLTGLNEIGLIAQDVKKVIPEVVSDDGNILSIQYGNMIALLIEGIKDLRKEIKNGQC